MKQPISYEEAVKKIFDRVALHKELYADWPWSDVTDDKSVLRNLLTLKGSWYLERDRETLFTRAKEDRVYHDMLSFALAEKVYNSVALETDEATWVAHALAGEHTTPGPKSRSYAAISGVRKFGLHTFTIKCVHILRLRGLKHRRACNAVAEAFGQHNLDIQSASTVNDIWKKNMPDTYRGRL